MINIPALKFLFVSLESLSGDLAWTIKKEGHEVRAYIKEKGDSDVYVDDVKSINGVWRVAGTSGVLLVITASAKTVAEARKKVYARISNIMVQDMFYRVDIGTRWFKDSDKLQIWGYL